MRTSMRRFALFALPAFAHAVTLSDFSPRADQSSLTPACKSVYTADITGCQPNDFQKPPCSTACVNGMADIAQQVQSSCPNHTGEDVISAFLAGGGPQRLCPNADSVLAGQSSAQQQSTSAQSTPAPSSTPTSTPQSTAESSTSSTTSVPSSMTVDTSATSATSTASSTSSPEATSPAPTSSSASATSVQTSSMVADTSAAPAATESASSTSSAESSKHTTTNDHSGGGSPFDSAGNMQSGASSTSPQSLALVLAAAFAVLSLHQ